MIRPLSLSCALIALCPAAQARDIAGEMAYRERIALMPGAQLVVELRDASGVVATARIDAEDRQVPLPFALTAPDNGPYTVQGAIFAAGRAEWVSAPVAVPAGEGAVGLGLVPLARQVAMGFASTMRCGDAMVEVGFTDQAVRLVMGQQAFDLAPVEAASGARYSDGAVPETAFWSKGNSAMVTVRGTELPECAPVIRAGLLPLTARGNEPFWRLDLTETGYVFERDMGATRAEGALPAPLAVPGGVRFDTDDGLSFDIERRLCRDTMAGMPHPLSVSVTSGGAVLSGCGGLPADLLAGAWVVEMVAGAALPLAAEVTMTFDAAEGRVFGAGGCNRYNGGFTLTGERLAFGPAAATMMACEPEKMEVERAFLTALDSIDRFDIAADGALELMSGDAVAVRARR